VVLGGSPRAESALDRAAPIVDRGLAEQLARLIETGTPDAKCVAGFRVPNLGP
jgi:hypothetical protein